MKLTNFAESTTARSPLMEAQFLGGMAKSSGKKSKKTLDVLLPLTSLIDAFSIIVIYLLIGTQGGGLEADIPSQLSLPTAEAGVIIESETPTVRIVKGSYFINDKKVATQDLAQRLADLKKNNSKDAIEILIQADQAMDYADLDPLLRAGSAAGIQKLKFAVVPTK